jgi:tRNA threonylcarbamoyl adenosine modification protein YeaZ
MSEPQLILGIETSASAGGVALIRGDEVAGQRPFPSIREQAREVVAFIDELLRDAGARPGDLSAVAVSVGPGSYTGLRVAVSAAKSLCWAAGVPLVPVESLDALGHEIVGPPVQHHSEELERAQRLLLCREAFSGRLFVRWFQRDADGWASPGDSQVLTPDELLQQIRTGDEPVLAVGDGIPRLQRRVGDASSDHMVLFEQPTAAGAVTVARRGRSLLAEGRVLRDEEVHGATPLYLRPSAAEEKADGAHPG